MQCGARRAASCSINDSNLKLFTIVFGSSIQTTRAASVLQSLELRLHQAREGSLPYEEFLSLNVPLCAPRCFRGIEIQVEQACAAQFEQLS